MNIYEKNPDGNAQVCIIWMHGLGSNSQDMMAIAETFPQITLIKHVFLDAPVRQITINNNMPMQAWYNVLGMKLTDREDKPGIIESNQIIQDHINKQIKKGFQPKQIFLAGFSQGGAMALYAGLNCKDNLGGIISLSAYLPLAKEFDTIKNINIPIFLAAGDYDPIVLPAWTNASYDWLQSQGFTNLSLKKYPLEHNVCMEEIYDIYNWINTQISDVITENIK